MPIVRAVSIVLALVSCAGAAEPKPITAAKPNIIFILTDDQGYGDLSCHGNPVLKTPHIDRLHAEGVRFSDFHVSPTCSPTRCSLMTGRHEFASGVTHTILERERMDLRATTLAEVLRSAGYTTGIFGKWHLGDEPDHWPDKRGFDEMFIHGCGGIGQTYAGSCGDAPGNTYFSPAILHNGRFEKTNGYCTDVFFGQALRWMEKVTVKGQRPFFAYITPNAPHAPLQVPPEYEARYAGKVPPNAAKFFGMIANIDDNVGRLLAKLREWGVERQTLVIFMNDNGGTAGVSVFNAGMRGHKGTPWLGGTRASSLWRWPGTLRPADCDRLAAHIDVFPTLAELAGAKLDDKAKQQVAGRSLVPLLKDPGAEWPDRVLVTHLGRWPKGKAAQATYAHCSVRNTRWHLVCDTAGKKQWQLFDVKADPGERRDVAAEHPAVVKELDAAYDRWWQAVQPGLVNENVVGPKVNSFKELYWKQFGGGPETQPKPKPKRRKASNQILPSPRPAARVPRRGAGGEGGLQRAGKGDSPIFAANTSIPKTESSPPRKLGQSPGGLQRVGKGDSPIFAANTSIPKTESSTPRKLGQSPPNILYIMADDHAAHAISAYGSKVNRTPHIDRLAKEGMCFANCFVTNSICTPSRAAIITGKYSHINGVPVFNRFDGRQPTLAKYLQAAGYHTGMIGKWHLGSDPTGFDYWNILPGQGVYHGPVFIEMGRRKKHQGYVTDLITDFSLEFLKKRPPQKPFFLMCHHKAPHRPWDPDARHARAMAGVRVPLPPTFDDDYAGRSDAAREATMRIDRDLQPRDYKQKPPPGLSAAELKQWKYQRYMQDYLACVASVDDNVGRLLDYLDREGLTENTIVVYTSDQGFFLGDHNWFDKRFMYEESLRMPLLVRWPARLKPGTTSRGMVLNVDFAPTLLAAAGLAVPADMQGRSFLPLLAGETPSDWRTSMYYRYYHYPQHHRVQPHYGVRTERYKLIYFNKLDQWELFDLKEDAAELKNLYNSPAHQETVKQLKEELRRLKKELKDEDQFADKTPKDEV